MPICLPCSTPRLLVRAVATATLLAGLAACHGDNRGVVSSAHAAAPSAAKGSFTGTDGVAVVAGRALQARAGQLTLDGAAYGLVDARSVAQLLVRNGQAMVTVNGRVRNAEQR